LPIIKETWKKNIKRNPNNSLKIRLLSRSILKNKMRNLKLKRNNLNLLLLCKFKRLKLKRTST